MVYPMTPATTETAYRTAIAEGATRDMRHAALTAATWLHVIQQRVSAERQEGSR